MLENTGLSFEDYRWLLTQENIDRAIDIGLTAVAVLLTLVFGYIIAGRVQRMILRRAEKSKRVDPTVSGFLSLVARYAILIIAFVAVLNQLGVATTSIVALLGAAGLAVALALQGTLSNIAAGVMLVSFRPFRVGHFIDAGGEAGTVKEIGLFATEITTVDNVKIVVPNNQLWAGSIRNFSAYPKRRLDLTFGVAYDTNLKTAEQVLRGAIEAERVGEDGVGRILNEPAEPFVAVVALADSSINFQIRVWCKSEDYWALRFHLLQDVKQRFDAAGVEIPFPTQTHITRSADGAEPEAVSA